MSQSRSYAVLTNLWYRLQKLIKQIVLHHLSTLKMKKVGLKGFMAVVYSVKTQFSRRKSMIEFIGLLGLLEHCPSYVQHSPW